MNLNPFRSATPKPGASLQTAGTARIRTIQRRKLSAVDYQSWSKDAKESRLSIDTISDRGAFLKAYLSAIARYIPSVSGSVWTWKNICSTAQERRFDGGTETTRNKAEQLTAELEERIGLTLPSKKPGLYELTDQFFLSLFKYGRFAGRIMVEDDYVNTFKILDPFKVRFQSETMRPMYRMPNGDTVFVNQNVFYYNGLDADIENPYGAAMAEASTTLLEIGRNMLDDMQKSSSNAGVPRLHIKIKQPPIMPNEDTSKYEERANTYFDQTLSEFQEIGPDDNFYTWSDVEIGVAGGAQGAAGFVWRTNLQIIDEEIMCAFHLFPWVLAKSFSTTKNWVQTQFDLLMTQAESLQKEAQGLIQWMVNLNLALNGVTDVRMNLSFSRPRDPAAKDMAIAERFRIVNVNTKVLSGWISPDDGARELGYEKAYNDKLLYERQKSGDESPINAEGA